jgi:hypothetical protein
MNKAQLQKNVGSRVRLRPQATEALGAHDDDWTVRKSPTRRWSWSTSARITSLPLVSTPSRPRRAIQGADAAGVQYGFLSLTVAVKLLESGRTDIESG